jgi:hypothetical protein
MPTRSSESVFCLQIAKVWRDGKPLSGWLRTYGARPRMSTIGHNQTFEVASQTIRKDSIMTLRMPPPDAQAEATTTSATRLRPERADRLAKMARPKLVARANEFFETCDGADASFNGFTETHCRFILAIRPRSGQREAFGISFVTCLYLSGPTFWSNAQLRCRSLEDSDGGLMYEVVDEAAGFVVRCDTIVVPTYDLMFAYELPRQFAG